MAVATRRAAVARPWSGEFFPVTRLSVRWLYAPLLTSIAYYAAAKLGFALTFQPTPVSTFWAPNAILMGAFLVTPSHVWPRLLIGALIAHFTVQLQSDVPLGMATSWFISNSSEALIGAALLLRYSARPFTLDRFSNVTLFLICCVFLAPFLSSFLDAAFVIVNQWGSQPFWAVWRHRFWSNILATVITVPVIVVWQGVRLRSMRPVTAGAVTEAVLLTASLIGVSVLVFASPQGVHTDPVMLYAPLPLLVWAVVRFGQRGGATALAFVVLLAIWSAVAGRGPFVTASPVRDALSIQLFFCVVAVTLLSLGALLEERKRAAETANREGEQLRLALESAQMATWDWPAAESERWLEISQRLLAGQQSDAVIYFAGFEGAIHPADLPIVAQAISDSTRTGRTFRVEFRAVDRHGRIRWMAGRGKMLHDDHGRPTRMAGLTTDITEKKKTELLIAGENRVLKMIATGGSIDETLMELTKLIEAESHDVICTIMMLDPDGVHVSLCVAPGLPESYAQAVYGMTIGPRSGSCGTAMYLRKTIISADIQRDPLWQDYRVLAARYGLRACWSVPIISDQGAVLGSFGNYYREVRTPSEAELRLVEIGTHLASIVLTRKRAEIEAHDQREALAHLGRVAMLGELAGAYAHELTQPLTAVLSNAQAGQKLLAREPVDLVELKDILDDIVAADMRASNVIHSLRPMLIKGQINLQHLDFNDLVLETHTLARADLEAREVVMTTVAQPDLPPVQGDRVQLQQVLLNLILNACDAMREQPRSERKLTVITRISADGDAVEASIADRGSGIPAQVFDRIFDPFFTSKRGGLGLGLAICRSIIQVHGGRLWAVNNPDRGATFHLLLRAVDTTGNGGNGSSGGILDSSV